MAGVRCLAALLAFVSLHCAAAPFTVRLGLDHIVLDTPPGFSDTSDLSSPRLQDLAATLTSPSNRVLMFALDDADLRRFMNGDPIEARRYLIAVTPKGAERDRVGAAQFATVVSDALRDLGKPVAPADYVKFLEAQPVGKANLFSELRKEAAVVSVLQGTRLPPLPGGMWQDHKPQYLFFTTTLLLVRGKSLRLAVYTLYGDPADVDWLKTVTQRWADELLRLNAR